MTPTVCQSAISMIQSFEQLRLKAFKPTKKDVWTIGWGHTQGVYEGEVWTKDQADEVFEHDIQYYAIRTYHAIGASVRDTLTPNQFGALVSFVYNIGISAFAGSTLLQKLNAGDFSGASAEFPKWVHQDGIILDGLVRRRAAERQLFDRA